MWLHLRFSRVRVSFRVCTWSCLCVRIVRIVPVQVTNVPLLSFLVCVRAVRRASIRPGATDGSLDVVITLPPLVLPAKLLVWNYNRSALLSAIGVKDARVVINGAVVWSGVVRKAPGKEGANSFTLVDLRAGPVPPKSPITSPPRVADRGPREWDLGGHGVAAVVGSGPVSSAGTTMPALIVTESPPRRQGSSKALQPPASTSSSSSLSLGPTTVSVAASSSRGTPVGGQSSGDKTGTATAALSSARRSQTAVPIWLDPTGTAAARAASDANAASATTAAVPAPSSTAAGLGTSTSSKRRQSLSNDKDKPAAAPATASPPPSSTAVASHDAAPAVKALSSRRLSSSRLLASDAGVSTSPVSNPSSSVVDTTRRTVVVAATAQPAFASGAGHGFTTTTTVALPAASAAPVTEPNERYMPSLLDAGGSRPPSSGSTGVSPRAASPSAESARSLQASWSSLEFFQKTNRGRISMLPPARAAAAASAAAAAAVAAGSAPPPVESTHTPVEADGAKELPPPLVRHYPIRIVS